MRQLRLLAWLGPALIAAGFFVMASAPALAEGTAADPNNEDQESQEGKAVEDQVNDIDQRLKILERKREIEQEQATEKAKQAVTATAGKEGFSVKSADGNFILRFRWIMQVDGRFYGDDKVSPATSTFLIRTARPILEATVYKRFDFRIMPDFGEGKAVLQDAYVEARMFPAFRLRAGKYKTPFGIERLQSETDTLFAERALPNNLVPNRDVGLLLGGDVAGGVLNYAGGASNGVVDGGSADGDTNDSKDAAARLFVHPFKKTSIAALQGFGIGVAATRGEQIGTSALPALPTYKSTGQQSIFQYYLDSKPKDPNRPQTTVADGTRARFSPQAYYYWGRAGLIAEYVRSAQDLRSPPDPNTGATIQETITNQAWQVAGSFLLTPDKASYRSVTPRKPIGVQGGGWGAVEITGRYSRLSIDEKAFPFFADPVKSVSAASAWGVGVNWHLNNAVKLMLDCEQTRFTGGAKDENGLVTDRETEKVLFIRTQMAF